MKTKYQVIGLILATILFILTPFGIPYLIPTPSNDYSQFNNYTCFGCDDIYDPTIPIFLTIILPIVVLIGLLITYYTKEVKRD